MIVANVYIYFAQVLPRWVNQSGWNLQNSLACQDYWHICSFLEHLNPCTLYILYVVADVKTNGDPTPMLGVRLIPKVWAGALLLGHGGTAGEPLLTSNIFIYMFVFIYMKSELKLVIGGA